MLSKLYIENIAVIERVSVDFTDGFSVLTGETGAGKSILIDAINLILGERASRELIRSGTPRAYVSAVFCALPERACAALAEYGVAPDENGELLIERELAQDGKSACRVAGRPTTAAVLRQIAHHLVNIHGQHDNQSLLQPERHLGFLDSFAHTEEELAAYRAVYQRAREVRAALRALTTGEREKEQRIDMLRYQIGEIDAAALVPGEEEALLSRQTLLRNAERIRAGAGAAYELLYGAEEERTAAECIALAEEELMGIARYAEDLEALAARASELKYAAADLAEELRSFLEGEDYSPEELAEIDDRLDLIRRLKKKYGATIDEILEYGETCRAELSDIELGDVRAEQLQAEFAELKQQLHDAGERLSEKRRRAAAEMERQVTGELASLDMSRVIFKAGFEFFLANGNITYTADGIDKVEFLISANPGEPPRPLSKIASGGELARIMLALKAVLADGDEVATLIFDEIDTGVSGSAADKIGRKLARLAEKKQVFCVTHLPQITAIASHHFLIRKQIADERTRTDVIALDMQGRIRELARMISGANITETALKNAEELLKNH